MREIEITTPGKRIRPTPEATEARYRLLVEEWERGDDTMEAVAARHGIAAGTLKWWRVELRRRDREGSPAAATTALVPVRVTAPLPSSAPKTATFEVVLNGGRRVVRIPPGFDPADVRALVEAVEVGPC